MIFTHFTKFEIASMFWKRGLKTETGKTDVQRRDYVLNFNFYFLSPLKQLEHTLKFSFLACLLSHSLYLTLILDQSVIQVHSVTVTLNLIPLPSPTTSACSHSE